MTTHANVDVEQRVRYVTAAIMNKLTE